MCYEIDAKPPYPPVAGGAADSEDLVLTAADGTQFAAFAARSAAPNGAGMVVLPDVRGLFSFYEELALRFAEVGVNSVAFDYFGRTAGVSKRDADFNFMPEVMKTTQPAIAQDVRAAVEYLRSPAGGSCTAIFTVGFCFGGSNSWNQAAEGHGLAGAIGFYGRPGPGFADQMPGPLAKVGQMECPILGLMGGADPMIPETDVEEFRVALKNAGVKAEVITYPGAPHSFFDRTYDEHKEACDDAWRRILAFIEENKK
ncbi:MAG: dienelactone hydrolase family protein [Dehalococcoidia bacterium]|nr:dienelactone hydrolase family protein [Dehalococcoidia bacterium]